MPYVYCPYCGTGKATAKDGFTTHTKCGYRATGPEAAAKYITRHSLKDKNPTGASECPSCQEDALVVDNEGFYCFSCGGNWPSNGLVVCDHCGNYYVNKDVTYCPSCEKLLMK